MTMKIISNAIYKIRMWLIVKLAGRMLIAINGESTPDCMIMTRAGQQALIYRWRFTGRKASNDCVSG